jgi:hypothetical protein
MPSKFLTVGKRLTVSVTDQLVPVLFKFLTKLTLDQTSSCLFYAIAVAENLLIFGADISNAFAKAPPPKQGFYIHPNKAFHEW